MLTINKASNFFVVDAEAVAYYRSESDVYDANMDSQGSLSCFKSKACAGPVSHPSNFASFDVTGLARVESVPNEEEAKAWAAGRESYWSH